ncbi:tudor domain-containing protein 15 [Gastrophryne carolinensis]
MDYMSLSSKPVTNMELMILNISCSSSSVLLKFQGRVISDCEFDYHILQKEIQLVPKVYEDLDTGQLCLVQDKPLGTWHRGKILDKINQRFEVVLVDQGNVVKVAKEQVASASGEYFNLPPKVVNGIFSNLLPLDEKWSPRAINYFSSLVGQRLSGCVKTTLPHQVILLEVPKVISYGIELNLAKYMDSDSYCLLVQITHNSLGKQMPDLLQQNTQPFDISQSLTDNYPHFQKVLNHLRPAISDGTVEKIKISAALSHDRFYCRILTWEAELQKLTSSMCSYYESLKTESSCTFGSYGALCAAKRRDNRWHRGVIQAIISCKELKVWFIDIGSSETIHSAQVYKLQPEFLSLPMMAIPCALCRVNDLVEHAKHMQLLLFKEALTGYIVIAQIDHFCSEELVFSVSLYEKEYELNANCHLTNLKVPLFSPNAYTDIVKSETVQNREEGRQDTAPLQCPIVKKVDGDEIISFKSLQMELGSVHVVYVEYALNPSNFWVRTDELHSEFSAMMEKIAEIYNKCEVMEMLLKDPQPGMLCCALYSKDGHYYRAVVTEVQNREITVYFIDFGNTETIPFYDAKILLPQFSDMPALAMCCTLAYAYPVEDVWVREANDFFKETVANKALLCHVLSKKKFMYVVEMRLSEKSENSNILSVLVEAGYAEIWNIDLNSNSLNTEHLLPDSSTKHKHKINIGKNPVAKYCTKGDIKVSLGDWKMKATNAEQKCWLYEAESIVSSPAFPICYKQYTFNPGAVLRVKCSHMESPGNLWCQLSHNLATLGALMDELQAYYKSSNNGYRRGQMACIAKSPNTGKYYRAAFRRQISRNEAEVIYVDFGKVEKVFVSELREIQPQFLKWEGQAFRCCLSNVFPPCGQHKWSTRGCKKFKNFLDNADNVKCTVIALFSISSEELCNVVDLETPYNHTILCENDCRSRNGWCNLYDGTSSVHLHTFCYSSFDLDVGSKENLYVTYVYNTGKFYCQLAKNENVLEMLMRKISDIGEKIKPEKGQKFQELCIVKYAQDGKFYRALACPVDLVTTLAFFVDFGDSQMVERTELLSIPHEALDVLFEPMQGLPCFLSGLKDVQFTMEAKAWFEDHCLDKVLSAAVVAKDDDGQLELDLRSGQVSINSAIKNILGVNVLQKKVKSTSNGAQCNGLQHQACEKSSNEDLKKKAVSNGKPLTVSDINANEINENAVCLSDSPLRTLCNQTQKQTWDINNLFDLSKATDLGASFSPQNPKKPFKTTNLPPFTLETGTAHRVFASYITSPSEIYIQLAKNEKLIMQLVEELNDRSFQPIDVKHLEKGVLVVAQYPDDKAFYRAEMKEILKANSFQVEFIDYGNTAIVDSSSIFTLPDSFLNVPRLSIPVFLKGFQRLQNCKWNTDALDKFCEKLTNESFDCIFLCRHDDQWEVSITLEKQSEFLLNLECFSKPSPLDLDNPVSNLHMLKPGQIEKVKHIYLLDNGILFVTLARNSQEGKITEHIKAAVQEISNRLVATEISEGMLCLAKSKKLQVWLRALVKKVFPETLQMSVFFVDHGACELISMHNAKKLTFAAQSIPHQAIACTWTWAKNTDLEFYKSNIELILRNMVQVQFLEFLEPQFSWKVELLVDGLMLKDLFDAGLYQAEHKTSIPQFCFHFESNTVSIPRQPLKLLEVCTGFVVTFQDPFSFTIQTENSVEAMDKLSQLMQKLPDELPHLPAESVNLGSVCLVKSFKEKEWCRAEIVSINLSSILVYLFDYGVYKSIPYSDYSKLKIIPKELAILLPLVYNCKLYGIIPKDGYNWCESALDYCLCFVQDSDLLILPLKINRGVTEVSICGAGCLAENLVSKGFASKRECATEVNGENERKPFQT